MHRETFGHRLVRSLALTLINLVVVLAIVGGLVYLALDRKPDVADGSWLVIDLYGELPAYDPPGSLPGSLLASTPLTVQDALDAMAKAAADERVRGVIWKLSASNGASWGKLQELRDGIRAVRDAGKPVYAWGDNLDLRTLYLAAACDSVYAPRGAYFEWRGLSRESLHLHEMLAKLGVEPHISKIGEYKSAAELVTEPAMTDPARDQAQRLLDETWHEVTATIAGDRGLDREAIVSLMERASLLADDAAAAGLIDRVLYWQGLEARLLAEAGDHDVHSLPRVTPATYREIPWKDLGRKGERTIAVVHAQGMIGGRENGVNPLFGITMGHESVVRELRRARLDEDVAAIVLRVDSPGGDGLTSDLIGHEVALCAAAKPTVVSMVSVGASGGYQIAFRATRMLANPLAVVGSIGSISGFFDASGLWKRLGVGKDAVQAGPMAGLGRDDRAPTAAEWEAFRTAHERDFAAWLREVAERRGYTWERAEQLAYGRVFTGAEAVDNGLIDGLGNLNDAIREAAALAGIAPETPLQVVHLPRPQQPLQQLLGGGDGDADEPAATALRAAATWQLREQLRNELQTTWQLLEATAVTDLR